MLIRNAFLFNLINIFIFLYKEIRGLIPEPDLTELEEKLKYLQRNIYKSFPYTRYGSSRDAFCYRRVNTHLAAFKVSSLLMKLAFRPQFSELFTNKDCITANFKNIDFHTLISKV